MATYRKIQDIDSFNNLVDDFLDTREELKTKVKEQKASIIESERVGQPPLTKQEKKFQPIVNAFGNYLELFNNFANSNRSSTEIKLSTKPNTGRIGRFGEVDLLDLQDNRLRVYNTNTKENISREISDSVAELLIKPYTKIDYARLDPGSWNEYMEIMRFVGIPRGANNNRKLRRPAGVQAAPPPQGPPPQGPQQPPMAPNLPPQGPRGGPPPGAGPNEDDDEQKEGDIVNQVDLPEQRAPRRRQTGKERDREKLRRLPEEGQQRRRDRQVNRGRRQRDAALYNRRVRRYQTDQFMNQLNQRMNVDPDIAELARGGPAPGGFFNTENPEEEQRGRGIFQSPDEMIDRLDLLISSQNSGNVSDGLVNEMMDIVDKLLDIKVISKVEHKKLVKKYINI